MPIRTTHEKARYILCKLDELGFSDHNRIATLSKKVLGVTQPVGPGESEYLATLEATIELPEWCYIFDNIPHNRLKGDFYEILERALSDAPLLRDAKKQSGRDAQLELFTAAILSKAGLPVHRTITGPDFSILYKQRTWMIEVKRVHSSSADKIKERLRAAATQVQKSGYLGIIILDVTPHFNPHNDPEQRFVHPDEYDQIEQDSVEKTVRKTIPLILTELRERRVVSVFINENHYIPAGERGADRIDWTQLSRWHQWQLCQPKEPMRLLADKLANKFFSACPKSD
ncbi:MAG: hypothetical protein ACF8K1_11885 [Phycisphaerales bacterium JB047]